MNDENEETRITIAELVARAEAALARCDMTSNDSLEDVEAATRDLMTTVDWLYAEVFNLRRDLDDSPVRPTTDEGTRPITDRHHCDDCHKTHDCGDCGWFHDSWTETQRQAATLEERTDLRLRLEAFLDGCGSTPDVVHQVVAELSGEYFRVDHPDAFEDEDVADPASPWRPR